MMLAISGTVQLAIAMLTTAIPWVSWTVSVAMFLAPRPLHGLATERAEHKTIMIDATYLKAHRTASSLCVKKGGRGRQIGRTKGGMNTKLHAVADAKGRPIGFSCRPGRSATTPVRRRY